MANRKLLVLWVRGAGKFNQMLSALVWRGWKTSKDVRQTGSCDAEPVRPLDFIESRLRFPLFLFFIFFLPVVPARGGAEVALKICRRPFSSIELACAVRQPSPCVRALCESCVLLHMSHVKLHFALPTSHCTLHTPHCTLHTSHTTLLTSHCTLPNPHFTLHCTLPTAHSTLHTSHSTLHTSHSTLHTALFSPTLHTALFTLHT